MLDVRKISSKATRMSQGGTAVHRNDDRTIAPGATTSKTQSTGNTDTTAKLPQACSTRGGSMANKEHIKSLAASFISPDGASHLKKLYRRVTIKQKHAKKLAKLTIGICQCLAVDAGSPSEYLKHHNQNKGTLLKQPEDNSFYELQEHNGELNHPALQLLSYTYQAHGGATHAFDALLTEMDKILSNVDWSQDNSTSSLDDKTLNEVYVFHQKHFVYMAYAERIKSPLAKWSMALYEAALAIQQRAQRVAANQAAARLAVPAISGQKATLILPASDHRMHEG